MKKIIVAVALVGLSTSLGAAPFTIVETGRSFERLADAVAAVGPTTQTIRIAPGVYRDCAIQKDGWVRYVAAQPRTAIFDGGICEGKAGLVLRGGGATIDGLVFQNFRVPEGNGSGIRLEKGRLVVANSIFRDSEQGILAGVVPGGEVVIERSTFSHLGRCDRGLDCAHSLYFGRIQSVTIRRSRFEKGMGGHYVKSRAARVDISDSSFDDTHGHATNYMVDLPEGSTGVILRNVMVQGRDKENHGAFIAVAAEGRNNVSDGLIVSGNRVHRAPGITWPTALLLDWTRAAIRIDHNEIGPKIEMHRDGNAGAAGVAGAFIARLKAYVERLAGGSGN